MQNEAHMEDGGFLIKSSPDGPLLVPDWASWWETTPEGFQALGWTCGGEIALADNYEGAQAAVLERRLEREAFLLRGERGAGGQGEPRAGGKGARRRPFFSTRQFDTRSVAIGSAVL